MAEQSKILVVKYDLQSVHKYKPDIVILELGTNDLLTHAPEVVGTKIDDLVHALIKAHIVIQRSGCWGVPGYKPQYSFCTRIGHWLLLPLFCGNIYPWSLLGKMGSWVHREFFRTDRALLSSDGVHCNAQGQYCLYRSTELSWGYLESSQTFVTREPRFVLLFLFKFAFCIDNALI